MKTLMKKFTSLLSAVVLSIGFMTPVFAEDNMTLTFTGEDTGFTTTGGSEYTSTDLFHGFKNVMPGDVIEQTITFSNKDTEYDFVALYLRAQVHDEENNPILDGEDAVTMTDFLSQLHMSVYDGEKLIYDSTMDDSAQLTDNVLLGRVASGSVKNLKVTVEVPIELGNEYMNRKGAVDWIFTVEIPDIPVTPERPETPLIPQAPNTGDHMNVFGFGIMGLLAAGAAVTLITLRRKHS